MGSVLHNEFLAALSRWDPDEVLEAADAVEALTKSPGWETVVKILDDAKGGIQGQLQHGGVFDQATYARELGRITGIEMAQVAAESILTKAKRIRQKRADRAEHQQVQEEAERALAEEWS